MEEIRSARVSRDYCFPESIADGLKMRMELQRVTVSKKRSKEAAF